MLTEAQGKKKIKLKEQTLKKQNCKPSTRSVGRYDQRNVQPQLCDDKDSEKQTPG